jgi:DNA-binding HxlR family transcriptional regulator
MVTIEKRRRVSASRRKGNLYDAGCPSRAVLDHVTSRWGSLVLGILLRGPHRFSELRRAIGGVSEKMLAQSLRALEGDGFVLRTVYPTVPPSVEYKLTEMGEEVAKHVDGLTRWVEENLPRVMRFRGKHDGAGEL